MQQPARNGSRDDLWHDFIWATGIEDTFVPQTRSGHRALDEYELMGHYQHWREDLALARDLGVRGLRWGVPWYRVEPRQGVFDWSWTDQVVPYLVEELGITPIVDLMHYGCPFWLQKEFAHPGYPEAVASYSAAFAERYRGLIRWFTPFNEPIMAAIMCGRNGVWPPYLRGDEGYAHVMVAVAKGIQATVRALKSVVPNALLVHVEATGLTRAQEGLTPLLLQEQSQHFLAYDLITGRVTMDHPLFPWLMRHGVSWRDLQVLRANAIDLDVIGLNFYPQWSTHELYLNRLGRLGYRRVEQDGSGFSEMIRAYHERYRAAVMITETSAHGDDVTRLTWLHTSLADIGALRADGVPVIGYTWFPMLTMIDWRYRTGRKAVGEYNIELGLFRLAEKAGTRWMATSLADEYRCCIRDTAGTVGTLFLPTTTPLANVGV